MQREAVDLASMLGHGARYPLLGVFQIVPRQGGGRPVCADESGTRILGVWQVRSSGSPATAKTLVRARRDSFQKVRTQHFG
jgi:hypothetical protein